MRQILFFVLVSTPSIAIAQPELAINGHEFPSTKSEFLRAFGKPVEIYSRPNEGPVESDSIWDYCYSEGKFTVFEDSAKEVDLDSIRIRHGGWGVMLFGRTLTPALTRKAALRLFRKQLYNRPTPSDLMLRSGMDPDNIFYHLDFRHGKLVGIRYQEAW